MSAAADASPVQPARPSPPPRVSYAAAWGDIVDGVRGYEIWSKLGWQDIRQRYRRSKIGPFWLTISMGVMISALGLVYSQLFQMDIKTYLPFLAAGIIVWGFISTMLMEGCTTFIDARATILEIRLPFTTYIMRTFWRQFIIFGHNIVIFVLVVAVFGAPIRWTMLLAPVGLALVCLNCIWIMLALSCVCARFRDLPQIIVNFVQIAFFITPILWHPNLRPGLEPLFLFNPFYHMIEVVRAPLLGEPAPLVSFAILTVMFVAGLLFTLFEFRLLRWRLPYWV